MKTLLDAAICTMMNVDWMLQIGLKLHTYFRIKAIKKKRLKLSLYPLPSCQRAFTQWHAALELVELCCWSIGAGPRDVTLPAVVEKLQRGRSSPCRKNKNPLKSTFLRYSWVMVNLVWYWQSNH